jgi:hypothetical protein
MLSQYNDDNVLHPMAYFSKKHSPTECNYEIYDKELMAIVRAFEEWCPELQSIINPIRVLSDHKNLEYFTMTKLLNECQAHWSQFLSQFNFKIVYGPGTAGGKLDALTRRSGDLPKAGDDWSLENQTTIIKPENILQLSAMATPTPASPALAQLITDGYNEDPFPNKILRLIQDGAKHCREISLAEYDEHNNLLRYRQTIWIPNYEPLKLHLLQQHDDVPAAGHPGRSKTLEYLCQNYTWPKMRMDIDCYTCNCHTCQHAKPSRHAPFGVLHPLPIPDRPWQDISMDFVMGLPWSNGCDAIWVVVDHLTKERYLVPGRMDVDTKELANLFIADIFRLHGLLLTIISDRGPQVTALFWINLCR